VADEAIRAEDGLLEGCADVIRWQGEDILEGRGVIQIAYEEGGSKGPR
jgi:hypothetical protein